MPEVVTFFKGEPRPKRAGRKPLPAWSPRRASERELRERLCEVVRRRDRTCRAELLVPAVRCGGPLDIHEVIPRSAWRDGYLVLSNVRLVCRQHHDWVGANVAAAHRLGLHGFSWDRPIFFELFSDV